MLVNLHISNLVLVIIFSLVSLDSTAHACMPCEPIMQYDFCQDDYVIQAKVIGVKTRSHKAKYYNAENEEDSLTKNVKMYNRYKIEIITAYKYPEDMEMDKYVWTTLSFSKKFGCPGLPLSIGRKYLLSGYRDKKNRLWFGNCPLPRLWKAVKMESPEVVESLKRGCYCCVDETCKKRCRKLAHATEDV